MPKTKSYKELYTKALLLIKCFDLRYDDEIHTLSEWEEVLEKTSTEDFKDYIKELETNEV